MHDFLRFVIVSFVFVSAVSCLVSVRDMRASAVVADPCVRPSCCPIRVCLGRYTGLPLRLRLASCRRGGGVLCIGWKGHGSRPPVGGFAGCGLSRCRMSSFAPRKAAYCAAIRGLPRRGKPRRAVALAAGRAAGGEKKLPAALCAAGSPLVCRGMRTACVRAVSSCFYFTATFVPFTM